MDKECAARYSPSIRRVCISRPLPGSTLTAPSSTSIWITAASPVRIEPGHYLRQSFLITLLNPKAIVFYMAFFPLFVDPARHQGLLTFGVMAATIAALTLLYGLIVVLLTHHLAERMRANPLIARVLEKTAGVFLIGFGVKLAISK